MLRLLVTPALAAGVACGAFSAALASDPAPPPAPVTVSAAVTGLHSFTRSLDGGGDVEWSTVAVSASVKRQFVPAFSTSVALSFSRQEWRFGSVPALGGQPPWQQLERQGIGVNFSLALSQTVVVGLTPSVEWAGEQGANGEDAIYGGVLSVLKVFSPKLVLGGGAAVYRQLYSVKASPFVIVKWQVSEKFRIANAIAAGPLGGGGVEAVYLPGRDWELAGGGVQRTDRFRLADGGPYPGQVGEIRSIPLFLRVSRNLGAKSRVDLYAGTLANGRLEIKNSEGDDIAADDYEIAPTIALTLSRKF